MQYIGSFEAAEKHISAKTFRENLHTSVKILQICMDLQDSVQRSLQNPAEKSCRSAQIRKDRKPGLLSNGIFSVLPVELLTGALQYNSSLLQGIFAFLSENYQKILW